MTDADPGAAVDLGEPGPGAVLVAHLATVLDELIGATPAAPPQVTGALGRADDPTLLALLDAQLGSRWLDVASRRLRAAGLAGTVPGSAGHEGDAALAAALRADDLLLPHHRAGALVLARAAGPDALTAAAAGLVAGPPPGLGGPLPALAGPGSAALPRTTDPAAHLPRALGLALALGGGRPAGGRHGAGAGEEPIAVVGFGDATAAGATAAGVVARACGLALAGTPLPLLLVCEDNGWGGSVPTPDTLVGALYAGREGLEYLVADTSGDPLEVVAAARSAVRLTRQRRRPVLLHLRCTRLGGHDAADVEAGYRLPAQIALDAARDPLAATMRAVVARGTLSAGSLAERFLDVRDRVAGAVAEALRRRAAGAGPAGAGHRRARVTSRALPPPVAAAADRLAGFGRRLPEQEGPLTLAQLLNRTLLDACLGDPRLLLLGPDLTRRGGAHGVGVGLARRLGPDRVLEAPADGRLALGQALGAAAAGLLPVLQLRDLAALDAGIDQLRGEAAALAGPGGHGAGIVVRVPGPGTLPGLGPEPASGTGALGLGGLRDVPGLLLAVASHPERAAQLLRRCLAAARAGRPCVLLEPAGLYHRRDLLDGDGGWLADYPAPSPDADPDADSGADADPLGRAAVHGGGGELAIVSTGHGGWLARRAAVELAGHGVGVRVLDLGWLAPLPVDDVLVAARQTGRLLLVEETRATGGWGEQLVTAVLEAGYDGRLARVSAKDALLPAGPRAAEVAVTVDRVIRHAGVLLDDWSPTD